MKVFGIGLPKTGTKSLAACFQTLGFHHLAWGDRYRPMEGRHPAASLPSREALWQAALDGHWEVLEPVLAAYDTFEDWPWPLCYAALAESLPDSRFVLTLRRTPELWLASLKQHLSRPQSDPLQWRPLHLATFGAEGPWGQEALYLRSYEEHEARVRARFASEPDRLLVLEWESEADWNRLARFLGKASPEGPLPHLNRSPLSAKERWGAALGWNWRRLTRAT